MSNYPPGIPKDFFYEPLVAPTDEELDAEFKRIYNDAVQDVRRMVEIENMDLAKALGLAMQGLGLGQISQLFDEAYAHYGKEK